MKVVTLKPDQFDNYAKNRDLHFFLGTTRQYHGWAKNPFIIIVPYTIGIPIIVDAPNHNNKVIVTLYIIASFNILNKSIFSQFLILFNKLFKYVLISVKISSLELFKNIIEIIKPIKKRIVTVKYSLLLFII